MGKKIRWIPGIVGLCLLLGASGCAKSAGAGSSYALDQRIGTFAASGSGRTADGFAADLAVVTDETSVDETLTAESAGVFPLDGGNAVFAQDVFERRNPASTTKVMTALIALKYGNLDDVVTVPQESVITESGSSMAGVVPGDKLTLEQLLYGLLIPSGNDAANAIAVHMGGSIEGFVKMMNEEAVQIGATALEYVTGVLMEMMFNMRYWDYSNKKFQIHGYICLTSSLFWGVLTVLLVCFVHIPVAALVASVPANILRVGLFFIIAVASVDTVDAFKKALDFQKLLTYETRIKNELSELTERLNDAKGVFTDKNNERSREFFSMQEARAERLRLELDAAKEKVGKFKNSMLNSFPSATSNKFGEALDEFKEYFNRKK